jgi:hypothetical protein
VGAVSGLPTYAFISRQKMYMSRGSPSKVRTYKKVRIYNKVRTYAIVGNFLKNFIKFKGITQVGIPKNCASDDRAPEPGSIKPGSIEIGCSEIGSPKIGSPKIGSPEIGYPEFGFLEIGFPEIGFPEISSTEKGLPEISSTEVGFPEISIHEIGSLESGPLEIGIGQINLRVAILPPPLIPLPHASQQPLYLLFICHGLSLPYSGISLMIFIVATLTAHTRPSNSMTGSL